MERAEVDYGRLVEQLLAGSERIHEMRKEIDAVVCMVLGFLNKDGKPHLRDAQNLDLFTIAGLCWQLQKRKGSLSVEIRRHEDGKLLYLNGRSDWIPLEEVQLVHCCLQDFLKKMMGFFPQLESCFAPLLAAAKA